MFQKWRTIHQAWPTYWSVGMLSFCLIRYLCRKIEHRLLCLILIFHMSGLDEGIALQSDTSRSECPFYILQEYLVPQEYVQIMRESMLNRCPVSSYEQVCEVFKKELGRTPDEVCIFHFLCSQQIFHNCIGESLGSF